jgi:hypothetical protein
MSVLESTIAVRPSGRGQLAVAAALLAIGVAYSAYNLIGDLAVVRSPSVLP